MYKSQRTFFDLTAAAAAASGDCVSTKREYNLVQVLRKTIIFAHRRLPSFPVACRARISAERARKTVRSCCERQMLMRHGEWKCGVGLRNLD